jgi:hypothetical protein
MISLVVPASCITWIDVILFTNPIVTFLTELILHCGVVLPAGWDLIVAVGLKTTYKLLAFC